jgi:hypothetical protein
MIFKKQKEQLLKFFAESDVPESTDQIQNAQMKD